jgi:hypothetical protein
MRSLLLLGVQRAWEGLSRRWKSFASYFACNASYVLLAR